MSLLTTQKPTKRDWVKEVMNRYGFNEAFCGSLEQWQTLNPGRLIDAPRFYSGWELISLFHPYEGLPTIPLNQRYASFVGRLGQALNKRKQRELQ